MRQFDSDIAGAEQQGWWSHADDLRFLRGVYLKRLFVGNAVGAAELAARVYPEEAALLADSLV